MNVVELSGGVGGARLARGLDAVDDLTLTVVVNVGDDLPTHGLYVSPDLDTVVYTLAGIEGTLRARNTFYFPRRVEPPVTGDPGSPRVIFDQASWSAPAEPVLERLLRVDDPFASARRMRSAKSLG